MTCRYWHSFLTWFLKSFLIMRREHCAFEQLTISYPHSVRCGSSRERTIIVWQPGFGHGIVRSSTSLRIGILAEYCRFLQLHTGQWKPDLRRQLSQNRLWQQWVSTALIKMSRHIGQIQRSSVSEVDAKLLCRLRMELYVRLEVKLWWLSLKSLLLSESTYRCSKKLGVSCSAGLCRGYEL